MAVTVSVPEAGICVIDITETDVTSSTAVTIGDAKGEPIPRVGRLFRATSVLSSGSGANVTPVLSSEDGVFDGAQVVWEGTAGAAVDDSQVAGIPYAAPSGRLYHRSTPDAGTDNVVATRYIIKAGLE